MRPSYIGRELEIATYSHDNIDLAVRKISPSIRKNVYSVLSFKYEINYL